MINLKHLRKQYHQNVILDDVSYCFPATGLVCFIGPSGSGKTTLLNLLAGFDSQYSGEISVNNQILSKLTSDQLCDYRFNNIGFIFQNYHLLNGYNVLDNVLVASELSSDDKVASMQKALTLLEKMGLQDKLNQSCNTLSGGQKQRVAIARALMSDPKIILCDEPTGALDRKTADEIMHLLKSLSKDHLVIVITHDQKVLSYADETISLKDQKIISDKKPHHIIDSSTPIKKRYKFNSLKMAFKNFKIHIIRYVFVAILLALGLMAFLFSLSFKNVFELSVFDFQQKNISFNNGYLQTPKDQKLYDQLTSDKRISNVYYQTKMFDTRLDYHQTSITIGEKYPMAKALEVFSYGSMPKEFEKQIALSINVAKKLDENFTNLLGQTINLNYLDQDYQLTISGLYNAPYDDFYISSDIERSIMQDSLNDVYAISYDVIAFDDIIDVTMSLEDAGYQPKTLVKEIKALTSTFDKLNQLFQMISLFILIIAIGLCGLLLFKLQNARYQEVGLLSAVGYRHGEIAKVFHIENILLSLYAGLMTLITYVIVSQMANIFDFPLKLNALQIIISALSSVIILMIISNIASFKLLHTDTAIALRK